MFFFLVIIFCLVSNKQIKGVSEKDQAKFSKGVTCEDGKFIPPEKINDDYCDCPNSGIDEPGTAACSSSSITEPTFYCENRGYIPEYIFPSRVGDGRCDCCDGSDEPKGLCPNTCAGLGKDILKKYEKELKVYEKAMEKRRSYVKYGTEELKKKRSELKRLTKEKEELEPHLETQRKEKKRLEDLEKAERKAWKKTRSLEKARKEIGEAEVELENAEDDVFFSEDEDLMNLNDDKFLEESDREVLLDGIKKMRRKMKVQSMLLKKKDERIEVLKDAILSSDKADYLSEDEEEKEEKDEKYVKEEAEEARKKYREMKDRMDELDREIQDLEELLEEDYGPDNEFFMLRDKCFSVKVKKKYSYELCPYGKATQKEEKSDTKLGNWKSLSSFDKDERYTKFAFEDGTSCWNGPKRSLTVELVCDDDENLSKVEEPSMCVYTGIFGTPAACREDGLEEVREKLNQLIV